VPQTKNVLIENRTQNVDVTAHNLYHRPNDDLHHTYPLKYHIAIRLCIGGLFKSKFESLISIYKLICILTIYTSVFIAAISCTGGIGVHPSRNVVSHITAQWYAKTQMSGIPRYYRMLLF